VRYDFRDTGTSTASPAGKPDYTGADLTGDAVALIDALRLAPVHLVGISMGGGLAQEIALVHPGRVATLTVLSTTAIGGGRSDLPGMSPELQASFAEPAPEPDWTDREAVIDHILGGLELFAGGLGVDRERARAIVGRMVDRTTDVAASQTNHWILAGSPEPEPGPDRDIAGITVPTLVLHGTDDPLFPPAHGEAIAAAVPGARFVPLPGVGHEMPPRPVWDTVVAEVTAHTAR
jgi:pimeloyl-ACP methyl ester carboxylesterase